MLMVAFGLVDVAGAAAVLAAAVGLAGAMVAGAAVGAAGGVVGLGAAVGAADVGGTPVVGGEVGATAVGVLHAANSGNPSPTTPILRSMARRAINMPLSYPPE